MNQQLIKLIELCLIDGVISDKERSVIFKKSEELGISKDECEIILEGMIQKHSKKNTSQPQKKKGFFGSIMDEVKKNIDVDSITDKVKSIQEEYEKKVEEITNQNQPKTTSSSKTSKPKSTTPKKVSKPKPTPSKPKKTNTKSSTSKKNKENGNTIENIKEEGELFSIDFFHVFTTEQVFNDRGSVIDNGKKIKLTFETWRVKKDSIVIYKLDDRSKDRLKYFLNPLKKYKKYESDYGYNRFKNKVLYQKNYGDTIIEIENTVLRICSNFEDSKVWNDYHFEKYCQQLLNKFKKQVFTFSKTGIIKLNQFDFKTERVSQERYLKIFGSDYVEEVVESRYFDTFQKKYKVRSYSRFIEYPISIMCLKRNLMFPYRYYLEIKTNIEKHDSYEIYSNDDYELVDEIGIEQYYTDSFVKLKILIEEGYEKYISYTEGGLQSLQGNDLVQFEKGENSLILDFDIYYQILKNNQEKIIKKDDLYIQKFIKLNNYLKEKYQNLDNILRKLKISIEVRKKEDFYENEREINFFKGLVYSYNLLVNHSIVMVTSLVENDMITFYEFYEVFDKMNVFNTNWENEVNDKLSEISESLDELNFSIKGLMSQMRSMEKKLVTQLQSINTSIGSLENSVNKQLSETNSRLKYDNLTSYYKKSTLPGVMDWFDGP